MKIKSIGLLIMIVFVTGCMDNQASDNERSEIKVGIVLADYGLGDQSFNDTAFLGLIKARNELGIIFDYRDLNSSGTYEQAFNELIEAGNDLIIGLGFNMIEDMSEIAKKNPQQNFLFIDENLNLPNVTSITFKEEEGSFIMGAIAALKTETNAVGFIGGMDIPVINRFKDGFVSGVHAVNPEIEVIVKYSEDFGEPEVGRELAREMIEERNVDIVYPAAGFTGLGAIEEAANQGIYAIGVDSDQFFVAERAVITSMLKNVDVAVYTAVEQLVQNGEISEGHITLGIEEDGVGAAPIRITSLSESERLLVDSLTEQFIKGRIQ